MSSQEHQQSKSHFSLEARAYITGVVLIVATRHERISRQRRVHTGTSRAYPDIAHIHVSKLAHRTGGVRTTHRLHSGSSQASPERVRLAVRAHGHRGAVVCAPSWPKAPYMHGNLIVGRRPCAGRARGPRRLAAIGSPAVHHSRRVEGLLGANFVACCGSPRIGPVVVCM